MDNAKVRVCTSRPLFLDRNITLQWTEILPRVPLGPSKRHLFKIPETEQVKFVKLNMYPDGGIVRLVNNCSNVKLTCLIIGAFPSLR